MKYEDELAALQQTQTTIEDKIQALQTKIASLNTVLESSSLRMRQLAVGIHTMLCLSSHAVEDNLCSWFSVANSDDAETADWTEEAHVLWLDRARHGVAKMQELGFIVEDPT